MRANTRRIPVPASLLGVSATTIRVALRDGTLRGVKAGRTTLVTEGSLRE
jgi:excisionase family DNA binding protein